MRKRNFLVQNLLLLTFFLVSTFVLPLGITNVLTNNNGNKIANGSGIKRSTKKELQDIYNQFPELKNPSINPTAIGKQNVSIPFTGFLKNNGQVSNSDIQYYYSSKTSSIGFAK